MPTRRSYEPRKAVIEPNGDLSTYSRFRDKLLLGAAGIILALVVFVVQDQIRGKSHDDEVIERRLVLLETDQRQFKDRVNMQFDERLRMLSSHAERIKGVEAEVSTSREEILRRLDRIESKMR